MLLIHKQPLQTPHLHPIPRACSLPATKPWPLSAIIIPGDRGYLWEQQPKQKPGSEDLCLQRQAFPIMAPSMAEEGREGTRIPNPTQQP